MEVSKWHEKSLELKKFRNEMTDTHNVLILWKSWLANHSSLQYAIARITVLKGDKTGLDIRLLGLLYRCELV